MKRRAVVTGYGVVTTIGNTVAEFWSSLVNGRRVPINSMTRYMLGTSGIVEIISTILSIQHGIIP
ncbi:hypothetical protein [Bacillus sp. S10(2024)]|uniref:hypothetical protein n=1 Tax=Bacillus sp. S10(2024) TaxID=3162886 RepID=UPI003D2270B2